MADEKTQRSNEPLAISPQPKKLSESQQKEIAATLVGLAEAVGQSLTPQRIDIYLQALADLPFERLKMALSRILLESEWFPKIPHIRALVIGDPKKLEEHEKAEKEAEAEAAWLRVLAYANKWHPDIGPMSDCPTITKRDQRALQFAGGIYGLWEVQDEGGKELAFIRRAFIESWVRADLVSDALQLGEFPKRDQVTDGDKGGFKSIEEILAGKDKVQ